MRVMAWLAVGLAAAVIAEAKGDRPPVSTIEDYIHEAMSRASERRASAGSLYTETGVLGEIAADLRARRVDDLVTIIVVDRASALSRGATSASRKGSARGGVRALGGLTRASGPLANLADLRGEQELEGQGETSRETVLTTTISGRVTHVLPNGNLVVEGSKEVWINAERQLVTVRGVVRWNDLDGRNRVFSDRLANLEVKVNGKGVVGDAIRRPNFLYRLLLGLLPF